MTDSSTITSLRNAIAGRKPGDEVAQVAEKLLKIHAHCDDDVMRSTLLDTASLILELAETVDRQRALTQDLVSARVSVQLELSEALAKAERYRWRIARLSNALLTEFTEDDIAILREVEPDVTKRLLNALRGGSNGEER